MWHIIEYLQNPYLVANFQNYFGVHSYKDDKPLKLLREKQWDNGVENSHKALNGRSLAKGEQFLDRRFSSESESEAKNYIIKNWLWYYLFVFGTLLGDEVFYASFIPFWFWNIDGAVGRRVVMVWAITMYIGQGIKDLVCWPRPPCPPVFRLQKKWSLEYGMPSTHAMVGVSIPFSVILYTMNRYQYPVGWGLAIAITWCTLISLSRIYLGMHSILDIVAGLILALVLMIIIVPIVDILDLTLLTSRWSPIILIVISITMIALHPCGIHWTPTRGDSTVILSVCVGIYIGAWINYQLGYMSFVSYPPPYTIIWPSYGMIGLGLLRTVIGLIGIIATLAVCKSASYATLSALLQVHSDELQNSCTSQNSKARTIVELGYKYVTYLLLGINIVYLLPNVFKLLSIQRPTFYTEI
uniref:Phosphatidic acid phosphatase type 2/haloperoxidase domain-containing protein n=1 Tax=Clastoptera arizonana TaxID=38151 RepID=A0A1B6D3K7_9HEMI